MRCGWSAMTSPLRPDTGRLSRQPRTRPWQIAILGLGAILILAVAILLGGGQPGGSDQTVTTQEHPAPEAPIAGVQPAAPEPAPAEAAKATAAVISAKPDPDLPQMGEAFIDRFDGGSLSDRWFVSDGWSNGSYMANDWQASSLELTANGLAFHLRKAPEGSAHAYSSGEIRTLAFFRYGYFEARMKPPSGSGIVTGLFTYADHEGRTKPNEIDIEILGRAPKVLELTIHENAKATSHKHSMPFSSSDNFHTYGFDWQPGHVRWYVDGELVHEVEDATARRITRPQQLLISLWASRELDSWTGKLDPEAGPWRLDVACVAYAPAFTGTLCD